MIKVNDSIIGLNFETQFDKNNRPFRLSGTIRKNDWVMVHRFKRLDDNSFFNIELNSKGDFLRYVNG